MRETSEQVIVPLFSFRLVLCLLALPVYAAVVLMKGGSSTALGIHLACGLSLLGLAIHPHWVLRGLERFRLIALGNFLSAVVYLGGAALWVHSPEDGVAAGLLWSAWFLVSGCVLIALLQREGIRFGFSWQPRQWLDHMRASFFFATSGALVLLYNYAPVLLLERFGDDYQVGLFGPPFRIILALGAAGFLVPSSFYPVLSKLHLQDRTRFDIARRRLHLVSAGCGLAAGVLVWLAAKPLTFGVLGEGYAEGLGVFTALAWMAPCQFLRNSFRVVLMAADLQRGVNLAFLVGLAITVALACAYIPSSGAVGAAWALVGGEASILTVMALLAMRGLRGEDSEWSHESRNTSQVS